MSSYEVQFIDKDGTVVDYSEILYYDDFKYVKKEWLNDRLIDIDVFVNCSEGNYVHLCVLDIWGSRHSGYENNDTYSKLKISSAREFADSWNTEVTKMFSKKLVNSLFK